MAASLPFPLAPVVPGGPVPVWTGTDFAVGGERHRVLSYPVGASGWHDDLTALHDVAAGTNHFIDVASREHALGEIRRHLAAAAAPVLLEVGCSSGHFLKLLLQAMPRATIVGADYVPGPLDTLAPAVPGTPLLRFDLTRCPLPDAAFDAVVLLNVLEHIERDDIALGHVVRVLKPGGIAVIEVPAGPHLFNAYDEHLQHFRRYSMRALVALAERAGLQVVRRSHLGALLYPAFWATKRLESLRDPGNAAGRAERVRRTIQMTRRENRLGALVMALEARLRRAIYLPRGIRCLVTFRKP